MRGRQGCKIMANLEGSGSPSSTPLRKEHPKPVPPKKGESGVLASVSAEKRENQIISHC